ncbi:MAG: hypothetical protein WBG46_07570 [Nonlabens sp.]
MKNLLLFGLLLGTTSNITHKRVSQRETGRFNFLNGTSSNRYKLIEKASYSNPHLHLEQNDASLWNVPVKEYADWYKNQSEREFPLRIGNILSIDYFQGNAFAKADTIISKSNLRYS